MRRPTDGLLPILFLIASIVGCSDASSAGDPAAAVPHYERSLELLRRVGEPVYAAIALMNIGAARTEAGDAVAGREALRDAERRMLALGGTKSLPSVYRDLAAAELAVGDLDAAAAAAERSLELARKAGARQTEAQVQRIQGQLALRRGDTEAARRLLTESAQTLGELGEVAELRRTEAVLATLG